MDVNWDRVSDVMDWWVDLRAEQCDVRQNKWRIEYSIIGILSAFLKG
jgi:hypothetical protein